MHVEQVPRDGLREHRLQDGEFAIDGGRGDDPLAARLFPKDHAQLAPGAVVEYPHLDGVFTWIAAQQRERDAARLANPKLSGREKHRLRAGAPARSRSPTGVKPDIDRAEAADSTLCSYCQCSPAPSQHPATAVRDGFRDELLITAFRDR